MKPTDFEQANCNFGPPPQLDDSQCGTIKGFKGNVKSGSIDGVPIIVTAWKPSPEEILAMQRGQPIFITFITNVLPPHMVTIDFMSATHPD